MKRKGRDPRSLCLSLSRGLTNQSVGLERDEDEGFFVEVLPSAPDFARRELRSAFDLVIAFGSLEPAISVAAVAAFDLVLLADSPPDSTGPGTIVLPCCSPMDATAFVRVGSGLNIASQR